MGASWTFLGITVFFVLVLAAIAVRTYGKGRKEDAERPKYRMLEDD